MAQYQGSCHCGRVAYEVEADLGQTITCNCSYCQRRGSILTFSPASAFTLTKGEDALTEYRFNTHKIGHQFCKTCGVSTFGHGPGMYAVNARTLRDFDVASVPVRAVDGASM